MNTQPDSQIELRDGAPRRGGTHVTRRMATASPRARARITGGIYLLFFLTALVGEFFTQQAGISGLGALPGDATATAINIQAHESFYLLGVALGLISTACYVAVTALFYQLFRPVSRSLAFMAAFFGLVGCAITAFGSLFQLAPLAVLGKNPYLSVFTVKQLQALVLLFLHLNAQVGTIALVFFGLFQILIGYLIFRSTFLPRILGVLMALAGLGWLVFLAPPLAALLLTYLEVLGILAEALLMLWLIVMGVNAERWNLTAQPNNAQIKAS
jgi:hypothetical protein